MSRESGGNALFLKILAGIFLVAALGVGLYLALRPASPQAGAGAPAGTPQSVKATPTGVQQMKPGMRGRRH
jgi:hypothetical protein